ncbi:BamA/TamA family outer membrane protein [candidate division WOR-3 bacterium]|nr:BamA/TamA family outer membrane protein [candidate division WOR-3 bacterium]
MGILLIILILSAPIIVGNKYFSSKLISKTLKEKNPEHLLDLYKTNGFLKVKIKVIGDTILIEEGPQFRIGSIKLKGNKIFRDQDILHLLKTQSNEVFNEVDFKNDMETILTKYENVGYPYCKIKPFDFELKADSARRQVGVGQVNFGLEIIEGPLVRISGIKVQGNKVTKDYVISRELRIKQGDIFSEHSLKEAELRLRKLRFLESGEIDLVEMPAYPAPTPFRWNRDSFGTSETGRSRQGRNELEVKVKEGLMNRVDGIIGYRNREFIGLIDLELLNLFGTGRAIKVSWQKLSKLSTFFELGYEEPWLFGSPINLVINGTHRVEDTVYIKNTAEILFKAPITLSFMINGGLCGNWIESSAGVYPPHHREEEYRGVLGIDFDTYGKSSIHYKVKTEYDTNGLERMILNLNNYLSVPPSHSGGQVFLSLNWQQIFRKEVPEYEFFKLGGSRTLRGYWEEEFQGAKVGWLNLEYRRFVGGGSYFFPFYDIGYISCLPARHLAGGSADRDGDIKQGFGLGVALNSPIGVITLAYGLVKGVSFMEGKIHLSISSRF